MLMHGVSADSSWTTLLAGFLVAGAGIGLANPAIATVAVGVVPAAKAGMGSGINTTFRQVGIATGVAALGAIFQSSIESGLTDRLARVPAGLGEAVASSGPRRRRPPGTAGLRRRAGRLHLGLQRPAPARRRCSRSPARCSASC